MLANVNQLTLATTKWCPYTCVGQGDKANIIGKYVSELLAKHNITLKIQSFPWARAVHFAENKVVDGLLTAIPSEAPSLIFTTTPIANFQVCFYSLQTNGWRYKSPLRLNGLTLGVINGYGYQDEIDTYVSQQETNERVISISGEQGLLRLIAMLKNKRVDVIVADKLVMHWQAKSNGINLTTIRNAGCTTEQPFYLAFNPAVAESKELLRLLDTEFALKENQQALRKIIEQYSF